MPEASTPLYFLIAGEASGDLLGARLMHAMKKKLNGKVRFAGIGGPRMVAEGLDTFFPQAELAHFGVFELLLHIPHILKRIRETTAEILRLRPTALITIDAPDFSFRVAKKLKGQNVPLIHYVAPTVWAWRPKRAKKIATFLDHLLVLLPFEPPYFTREGLACTFVGHPIVESDAAKGDAARFRTTHNIPANAPLLSILPGSRSGEISRLMPVFAETVAKLKAAHPDLHIAIPAAPGFKSSLQEQTRLWPLPVTITETDQDKYDTFAASRVALACSGTVALELAMARLPAVIAYKISGLTYKVFRRMIKIDYVNLVNLMHNSLVVPELLQQDCTPQKLASAVGELLDNEAIRKKQIAGLSDVAAWLGQGQFIPSERAAETVLKIKDRKNLNGQQTYGSPDPPSP
jgi:lipid-A-disaccharide synthase